MKSKRHDVTTWAVHDGTMFIYTNGKPVAEIPANQFLAVVFDLINELRRTNGLSDR